MLKIIWRSGCVFLIVVLFMMSAGCLRQPIDDVNPDDSRSSKYEEPMVIDQKMFLKVPLNSNDKNPCSPLSPGPKWRGIMIQAPRQVEFKRGVKVGEYDVFALIPICGFSQLDVPLRPVQELMQLVAADKKTGDVYRADIVELDPSPIVPPPAGPPPAPADLKGVAVGSYFNPNLADYVSLPEKPGIYEVYVVFRKVKSNVVTIEIVEK